MHKLCECEILLYIYDDEKKHIYEYRSTPEFDWGKVQKLIEQNKSNQAFPTIKLTKYVNEDYEQLTQKHLPPAQWENGMQELQDIIDSLGDKNEEKPQKL